MIKHVLGVFGPSATSSVSGLTLAGPQSLENSKLIEFV